MNFYNVEQFDIDVSVGQIYFFWNNKPNMTYIYDNIYNPLGEVKGRINSHYWNFRRHKDGTATTERVMSFINEVESLLYYVKEEHVGGTYCTSVVNKFADAIYYELANKFYILMYGTKAYKKSGGEEV